MKSPSSDKIPNLLQFQGRLFNYLVIDTLHFTPSSSSIHSQVMHHKRISTKRGTWTLCNKTLWNYYSLEFISFFCWRLKTINIISNTHLSEWFASEQEKKNNCDCSKNLHFFSWISFFFQLNKSDSCGVVHNNHSKAEMRNFFIVAEYNKD